MNSSNNSVADKKDTKLNMLNKVTTLNPNAAEFVPSSLKHARSTKISDVNKLDGLGSSRNAVLDRSETTASNNSEDEAHQYWHHHLPDDITPDFKVMGEELQGPGHLSIAALSIHDTVEPSRFSGSMANQILGGRKDISSFASENSSSSEKMDYSGPAYAAESSAAFMTSAATSWGKPFINGENHSRIGKEGCRYIENFSAGSMNDLISDDMFLENAAVDPIKYLSSQFPGFDARRLANVYYENGGDLSSTIEFLTQYMHEIDSSFNQNLNSKPLAFSRLSMLDFTALPVADARSGLSKYTREDIQHSPIVHRSTSSVSRGDMDFSLTIGQLALRDSGNWSHERNGFADGGVGTSRTSQLLASSFSGNGKMLYGDKGPTQSHPVWLETGEAVESGWEDHDFANLQNACFKTANQAYSIGDKALAKELSLVEQLYNLQINAAHGKAKESIYRQRNPLSPEPQSYSQVKDQVIDLYGLPVTEAIQSLNDKLRILRSKARCSGQQLHAIICIGIGHHTKGTRTPAWLPVAVEQYLIKEGLYFTQPQPGLLRVVIN